jgi:hypothetical protein
MRSKGTFYGNKNTHKFDLMPYSSCSLIVEPCQNPIFYLSDKINYSNSFVKNHKIVNRFAKKE